MRSSFKTWRQTIGVVTLLMVLLLTVGCIRSFFAHDSVGVPITKQTTIGVMSAWNSLIWCVQYHDRGESAWKITKWTLRADPLDDDAVKWVCGWGGFGIGKIPPCQKTSGVESVIVAIPYWSLTGSLFLLSCRLLQVKPEPINWSQGAQYDLLFVAVLTVAIVAALLEFLPPPVQ